MAARKRRAGTPYCAGRWGPVVLASFILSSILACSPEEDEYLLFFSPAGPRVGAATECPPATVPFECNDICDGPADTAGISCEEPDHLNDWLLHGCSRCGMTFGDDGVSAPFPIVFY